LRRLTGREYVFSFIIILSILALGYSVYLRLDLGVFLATAIGSLGYVVVALYDKYILTADLKITFDPKAQDLNSSTLTLLDSQNRPTTNARVIRVLVRNDGKKKARSCVGYLELVSRQEGCTMLSFYPSVLGWQNISRTNLIPAGGFASLGVAISFDKGVQLDHSRCDKLPGNTLLHTWAYTPEIFTMGPSFRLQDAFCAGTYVFDVVIYSEDSGPARQRFSLKIGANWNEDEMTAVFLGTYQPQSEPQAAARNLEVSLSSTPADEEYDRRQRIAKLDSALLFLSSTVGVMFAVLRSAINPATSLVAAGPLVVLGVVLPFYYGYVRGALVRSSIVDRYRGWIFFLVGLSAYGYNLVLGWMNQILPLYVGRSYVLFDIPVGLALIPLGYVVAKRVPKFFFQALGAAPDPLCFRAGVLSVLSASLFAGVGSNLIFIQSMNLYSGTSLLLLLATGLYLLNRSGRYAGYANLDVQYTVLSVQGRWHGRVPQWIGYVFLYAGIAVFLGSSVFFVAFATSFADVVNAYVELAVAFLLLFVGIRLQKLTERKDVYRTVR